MITQSRLKEILHYDPETGIFTRKIRCCNGRFGVIRTSPSPSGYYRIMINSIRYYAHKLAWLYIYGELPTGNLDHINRIRTDNRISNLRIASNSQNCMNCTIYSSNTSGQKGVNFSKKHNTWIVRCRVNNIRYYLGCYKNKEDAINIYIAFAKHVHGVFYTEGKRHG